MNVMKPFGMLFSQGEQYYLLNPNPLPVDSQWRDGTYMFFVATYLDGRATHVITNSFCLEYDAHLEPIEVQGILTKEAVIADLQEELNERIV